ncbi:hypothetical protein [Cupriavidus sp. L7L]|uniref:hypothetical protein n=1 Tax=Cupriavidus sp. L7L TaxID=2546443 RepID=UPI0010551EF3|nr:hypothetical protein [Cupriavidus sp. L7L]TDF63624.1 hypothetical protein E1J61_23525 [Cupriavidus sp. L7L]
MQAPRSHGWFVTGLVEFILAYQNTNFNTPHKFLGIHRSVFSLGGDCAPKRGAALKALLPGRFRSNRLEGAFRTSKGFAANSEPEQQLAEAATACIDGPETSTLPAAYQPQLNWMPEIYVCIPQIMCCIFFRIQSWLRPDRKKRR